MFQWLLFWKAFLVVTLLLLMAGLWKPAYLLFWEAVQTRRKVLKVYGTAAILITGIYLLVRYFVI